MLTFVQLWHCGFMKRSSESLQSIFMSLRLKLSHCLRCAICLCFGLVFTFPQDWVQESQITCVQVCTRDSWLRRSWWRPFYEGLTKVGNRHPGGSDTHSESVPDSLVVSQFSVCILLRSNDVTMLREGCPNPNAPPNAAFFSLFLEDAPLLSFMAFMATSRGVDRHFHGPGRQKFWREGKTSGNATRKCSKG